MHTGSELNVAGFDRCKLGVGQQHGDPGAVGSAVEHVFNPFRCAVKHDTNVSGKPMRHEDRKCSIHRR